MTAETLTREEYVLVPIVHLLKHPDFFKEVSLYILVSEKYIRLNFAEDPFQDILNSLLKKGGSQVYIVSDDFNELLHNYQKKMLLASPVEFDEIVTRELKISENETMIMLAQTFIKTFGLSKDVIEMVETSNKNVQKIITNSRNLAALLESFRKNCSEEYFKIAFTNYVCSVILNHFPWSTPQILEKLMLASTICDLSMTTNDVADLRAFENDEILLPENVRNHPLSVIDLIKDDQKHISLETITIIKQHHERPDGKGYPTGVDHARINQLSAIFIVAQRYAEKVCESENGTVNYLEVAQKLKETYHGGFFSKATNALIAEVSKIK